jgi:acetate kinase
MDRDEILASGVAERIGEGRGILTHKRRLSNGASEKSVNEGAIPDHQKALTRIVALLTDQQHGVVKNKSEISAVGHRVVHGGETFQATTIINEEVIEAIRENIPLAPLHNPPNLMGIEVARSIFPGAPQVAVFDTSFHQTIPVEAFLYAIPYRFYEKARIRRYGFHGTSHAYVAGRAAEYLDRPLKELNLITIHLGNGASMAALKNGICIDTSMGMTPLEGLVMGTRSGDIDPALPAFLGEHLGMTLNDIDELLNKASGLKGICGTNDMREVLDKRDQGNEEADLAVRLYCYRIKKYIGAYYAALGRLDGIIFTAGIGENASSIRELSCQGLKQLGIAIDSDRNGEPGQGIREINAAQSRVRVLVVPTNEELKIAQEVRRILESSESDDIEGGNTW